ARVAWAPQYPVHGPGERWVSWRTEDSPRGLGRTLGKRVGIKPSRVRISYPPHRFTWQDAGPPVLGSPGAGVWGGASGARASRPSRSDPVMILGGRLRRALIRTLERRDQARGPPSGERPPRRRMNEYLPADGCPRRHRRRSA